MESNRRTPAPTKPTSPAVVRGLPPAPAGQGFFARHGNTILTAALLLLAVVLAVRWWNRSADSARAAVVQQVETARGNVDQLRSPNLLVSPTDGRPLPAADVVAKVRLLQTTAAGQLDDVINKADAPAIKARALVVRGDLNWALANLPELPGAATQPALRPEPTPDDALRQSADAYSAALGTTGADKEAVAAARLGLAAVAENRGDWAGAKQQLQSVADDTDGVAVLSAAARVQLAQLPTLQKPMYLTPPGGVAAQSGVMGPVRPTTLATTVPTTRPAK